MKTTTTALLALGALGAGGCVSQGKYDSATVMPKIDEAIHAP